MRQRRLQSLDEVEFEVKLLDGRTVEVFAWGKVIGAEGYCAPHVEGLFLQVWWFKDLDDLDGKELGKQDIPGEWERLEQFATDALIEKIEFMKGIA